ncbi:MAG: SLBB domain-containing protein [Candidatus Paceibacterota bacterium]
MQWGVVLSQIFGGNKSQALQLLSGLCGFIGIAHGLNVLMVERTQIPVCSVELLEAVGEQNFLKQQTVTVEVAGAVVQPGVWQVSVGSRVADAIEKAGGFSQRADRTFAVQNLNLAKSLLDGEKIYVPFEEEKSTSVASSLASNSNQNSTNDLGATDQLISQTGGLISINNSSDKELQTLPGIGEVRASKIIENRPYTTLGELVSKDAITEGIFASLNGLIVL